MSGRTVLLCTMKHAQSQFMYLPILRTLEAGFRGLGGTVTMTSGAAPARRAAQLETGDAVVWVGSGRGVDQLPLRILGARGVHRVLYTTEPMRDSCAADVITDATWDEVWHYTLHNAHLCWQHAAHRAGHRYVPPGALDPEIFRSKLQSSTLKAAPVPNRFSDSSRVSGGGETSFDVRGGRKMVDYALFLGIIPRNTTPSMPGYARRACYNTLFGELGRRIAHRENVFNLAEMRRLLRAHGVFVNLHKDCGVAQRPAEAVRFSMLLSVGARIVSENSNQADEEQFAGFVTFVPLARLGAAIASALTQQSTEPDGAAQHRAEAFRKQFAPSAIFARAGLGSSTAASNQLSPCRYEPSRIERAWTDQPAVGRICSIARQESQLNDLRATLAYAQDSWGTASRAPTPTETRLLSRLICADSSRDGLIEPLTGVARHPLAKVGCSIPGETSIFDISHLVLHNRCQLKETSTKGRNLLFDLGCSTFAKIPLCELHPQHRRCTSRLTAPPPAPPHPPPATGGTGVAHGPSLPLFIDLYRQNCVNFDRIYAWEAVKYKPQLWWRDVPVDVRSKLDFYNVPIDETPNAHADPRDNSSFLRKLSVVAKPEDFVVLKVDIDGGPELAIVEAIAASSSLASLVDEIFFEYHFWFDGMIGPGWQIRRPGARGRRRRFEIETNATVDDALALMRKLRERGIRSHFWV